MYQNKTFEFRMMQNNILLKYKVDINSNFNPESFSNFHSHHCPYRSVLQSSIGLRYLNPWVVEYLSSDIKVSSALVNIIFNCHVPVG